MAIPNITPLLRHIVNPGPGLWEVICGQSEFQFPNEGWPLRLVGTASSDHNNRRCRSVSEVPSESTWVYICDWDASMQNLLTRNWELHNNSEEFISFLWSKPHFEKNFMSWSPNWSDLALSHSINILANTMFVSILLCVTFYIRHTDPLQWCWSIQWH